MKPDYLFVNQDEIFTPSFIQTKDTIFGNATFVTQKAFQELAFNAKKFPKKFLKLLNAYAIVAPNSINPTEKTIFEFEDGLPIPMGVESPNSLIVGPSGVGKTSKFTLPLLFDSVRNGRSNVLVCTGGNQSISQALTVVKKAGGEKSKTYVFDLRKTFPYNPFIDLVSFRAASVFWESIAKIVGAGCRDESAWVYNQATENLAHLTKFFIIRGYSLHYLRKTVLSGSYEDVLQHQVDGGVLTAFVKSLKIDNRNSDTVQSTMREMTAWIDIHSGVFEYPSFSFYQFVKNGGNIIVNLPIHLLDVLKPYVTAMIGQLVNIFDLVSNESATGCIPHQTVINLDELATCPLSGFTSLLHVNRKQGWSVAGGCQSVSQIHEIFGQNANTILAGFQSKICLPQSDHITATYFSNCSGKASMITPEFLRSKNGFIQGDRGVISQRQLFLDSDITAPKKHPLLGQPSLVITPELIYQAYITSIFDHGLFNFSENNFVSVL